MSPLLSWQQTAEFRWALLAWYRAHRRDLPWRKTRDPYRIWISEIMLQQTRVAAVLDHYGRFLERFPTIETLAAAAELDVLALWSGLGYYRRARMMRRAARVIVERHSGRMPETAAALLDLPGIGSYTSAAIASIAFDERVPVVDGNVERVLARIAAWSAAEPGFGAEVRRLAGELVDPLAPGDFNQAIMELGATVCLPKGPLCLQCPVQPLCWTRGEHVTAPRKKMQTREVACVLSTRGAADTMEVLLEQRSESASLMAGMWQLPEAELRPPTTPAMTVRHAITTTNYKVHVYVDRQLERKRATNCPGGASVAGNRRWFKRRELAETALTGLARKVLRLMEISPERTGERPLP